MTTTPMRSQYLAIKKQYPDIILLFRLGDFYETFDDDAKIVASVCDVVLTSRPVGADERVPLAGVPYHAVDGYIAKLINAGYKVAIAEQIGNEPPKGEKLVARVVRRVVTPGTLVEPGLLAEKRNNYIAALVFDGAPLPPQTWGEPDSPRSRGFGGAAASAPPTPQTWGEPDSPRSRGFGGAAASAPLPPQTWGEPDSPRSRGVGGAAGLAYADISTGEFATTEISDGADVQRRVAEELGRLAPAELLWPAKDPRWAGRTTNDEGRKTDDESRTTHHAPRNTQYAFRHDPFMVTALPRHPLRGLALRGKHRPAGAAGAFSGRFAGGLRLR